MVCKHLQALAVHDVDERPDPATRPGDDGVGACCTRAHTVTLSTEARQHMASVPGNKDAGVCACCKRAGACMSLQLLTKHATACGICAMPEAPCEGAILMAVSNVVCHRTRALLCRYCSEACNKELGATTQKVARAWSTPSRQITRYRGPSCLIVSVMSLHGQKCAWPIGPMWALHTAATTLQQLEKCAGQSLPLLRPIPKHTPDSCSGPGDSCCSLLARQSAF